MQPALQGEPRRSRGVSEPSFGGFGGYWQVLGGWATSIFHCGQRPATQTTLAEWHRIPHHPRRRSRNPTSILARGDNLRGACGVSCTCGAARKPSGQKEQTRPLSRALQEYWFSGFLPRPGGDPGAHGSPPRAIRGPSRGLRKPPGGPRDLPQTKATNLET